jgi:hypothetical protein
VGSEIIILVCGMAAEIALILLMLRGRVFRTFPAFFIYLCWSLFSDALFYYVQSHYSAKTFLQISLVQLAVDSVMIFALLVELAWSVLRPIRNTLPKYSWIGIAGLIALGGLILWPVAGLTAPAGLVSIGMSLFRLQQTAAILRAVFFLALAAFSQALSIGWRDRELQIASGLGFFSIVSLAVAMIHTHQAAGTQYQQYHWLDRIVSYSYLVALVYWDFAFAAKPVERREFTPQMQSMLLAVAGAARTTRVELSGPGSEKGVHKNER